MDQDLHYNFDIERIREQEFPNLKGVTYVDHVGTTLYARSQIEAYHEDLLKNVYGNPHSRSQSSRLTTDTIDQVRFRILQFFNASPDEYSVIFTSGCTSALKLVAETFSFHEETSDLHQDNANTQPDKVAPKDGETSGKHENSETQTSGEQKDSESGYTQNETQSAGWFVYLLDNHTSVQGMRELVSDRVSRVFCLDEDELQQVVPEHLNQIPSSDLSVRSRPGLGLAGESSQDDGTITNQKSNPLSLSTDNPNQMTVSNQIPSDQTHYHYHNQSKNVHIDYTSPKVQGCAERFKHISNPCHLFAYPAQSNFSGRKYPLEWIKEIQDGHLGFQKRVGGRWFVVLDAASYVSSSKLDLQEYKPDFVAVSFYKIFGFPTGLGALLVRKRAEPMLCKRYFGGGTVSVSNARERFHVFRSPIADRFEDGTVSFLDIISLRHGLDIIHRLAGNMERVSQHTFSIARYFHDNLLSLRHGAGGPVAEVYGPGFEDISRQGAIVNFNILKQDGQFVGFAEVDKLAQLHDIHLRTGCFCNIGACQKHLSLTSQQIRDNFDAGHVCGDDRDMIEGRPTGSIRVSFGYMSTFEDASQCLKFIAACFLEGVSQTPDFRPPIQPSNVSSDSVSSWSDHENKETKPDRQHGSHISDMYSSGVDPELQKVEEEVWGQCGERERYLTKICLYPVKSCAAFQVPEWEVGPRGLVYDREWMIVSESGVTLGQKREPRLCLLQPRIDFLSNSLTLSFPDTPSFTLSLSGPDGGEDVEGRLCTNKVCGDRVNTYDCGDAVADWLSDILGRPGTRLLRQNQTDGRTGKLKDLSGQGSSEKMKLSLANESQFLLISRESVRSLQKRMSDQEQPDSKLDREHGSKLDREHGRPDIDNLIHRFRGNLVVGGGSSFEEEHWGEVVIGTITLVSQGPCSRCQMVCMDQQTGERSREPLRTLVSWRGKKVPFGVYMRRQSCPVEVESSVILRVGDLVVPHTTPQ